MVGRTLGRVVRALPRAVVLGFGTILGPKARPDEHWSASPEVVIVHEAHDVEAGAPPRLPRTA